VGRAPQNSGRVPWFRTDWRNLSPTVRPALPSPFTADDQGPLRPARREPTTPRENSPIKINRPAGNTREEFSASRDPRSAWAPFFRELLLRLGRRGFDPVGLGDSDLSPPRSASLRSILDGPARRPRERTRFLGRVGLPRTIRRIEIDDLFWSWCGRVPLRGRPKIQSPGSYPACSRSPASRNACLRSISTARIASTDVVPSVQHLPAPSAVVRNLERPVARVGGRWPTREAGAGPFTHAFVRKNPLSCRPKGELRPARARPRPARRRRGRFAPSMCR